MSKYYIHAYETYPDYAIEIVSEENEKDSIEIPDELANEFLDIQSKYYELNAKIGKIQDEYYKRK